MKKVIITIIIIFIATPLAFAAAPSDKLLENTFISNNIVLKDKKYIDLCKKEDCGLFPLIFPMFYYKTDDDNINKIENEINTLIENSYNDVLNSKISDNNASCSSVKDKYTYELYKNNVITAHLSKNYFSVLLEQQIINLCTNQTSFKITQYLYDMEAKKTLDQAGIKKAFDVNDKVIRDSIDSAELSDNEKTYLKNNLNNYYIYIENDGALKLMYYYEINKNWKSIEIYENVDNYYNGHEIETEEPKEEEPVEEEPVEKKEEKEKENPTEEVKENKLNTKNIIAFIVILIAVIVIIISIYNYKKISKNEKKDN